MKRLSSIVIIGLGATLVACGSPSANTSGSGGGGAAGGAGTAGAAGSGGNGGGGGEGGHGATGSGGAETCASPGPTHADLFVAPDGDDAWSGTLRRPNADRSDGPTTLKAVEGRVKTLQPGRASPIVVFLEDGTYDLPKTLPDGWSLTLSGTTAAPIVYAAEPGATPVLSGGVIVSGWTTTTVNGVAAWKASAAGLAPFEQLWVDGGRRYRPTTTPGHYLYNANAQHGGDTSYTDFFYAGNDVDPGLHDLARVEIVDFENWTAPRMHIASIDTAAKKVTLTGSTSTDIDHGFMPGHRYLVDNVQEELKRPGQFYLDRKASPPELYYIPSSAHESPDTSVVVAPQIGALLTAVGVSHVTLHGLSFSYSNWTVPDVGWQDSQTQSNPKAYLPAAVSLQKTSFVDVEGCTFSHLGGFGVEIVGQAPGAAFPNAAADCTTTFAHRVVDSVVTDIGGGGIRIGTQPNPGDDDGTVPQCDLVEDNAVSAVGRFLPSGNAIFVGNAHHVVVRHNDVFDTYTYAIDIGATYGNRPDMPYDRTGNAHDILVDRNHVHQVGQGVTSDIGGIYTATGPQTGNVVQNNVVHDVTHDPGNPAAGIDEGYGGWGLYNDASSSNVTWKNNLAYNCSQASFHFHYGADGVVENNIFAFGTESTVENTTPEAHLSFTFRNNIVYWDSGDFWQRGDWRCPLASASLCRAMTDNLYVDAHGTPVFITGIDVQDLTHPAQGPTLTFAEWQATGEDPSPSSASFALDFGTPDHPNFTVPAHLPIPFVPFDPAEAGRTCAAQSPADVAPGFPIQSWPAAF